MEQKKVLNNPENLKKLGLKNKNFLNSQNYILGNSEKKKVLTSFLLKKITLKNKKIVYIFYFTFFLPCLILLIIDLVILMFFVIYYILGLSIFLFTYTTDGFNQYNLIKNNPRKILISNFIDKGIFFTDGFYYIKKIIKTPGKN